MTTSAEPPPARRPAACAPSRRARPRAGEIDMLVGQATPEAARHEQKRAQAAEKPSGRRSRPPRAPRRWAQLVTLTRRAVLMEAQVDVLEGKRRALARHRDAIASLVGRARRDAGDEGLSPEAGRRAAPTRPAAALARRDERPGGPPARHRPGDARRAGAVADQHRAPGGDRRAAHGRDRTARGASCGCWWRWSSRRSTRPRTSSSTSGRWCSTTWARADPAPHGARPRPARARSRWSSTRWARTGGCRWTSRARSSGSSTRRWRRTSA